MSKLLPSAWTDERIERAKSLWAEGVTASAIARTLDCGLSRHAVIGKMYRLGAQHGGDGSGKQPNAQRSHKPTREEVNYQRSKAMRKGARSRRRLMAEANAVSRETSGNGADVSRPANGSFQRGANPYDEIRRARAEARGEVRPGAAHDLGVHDTAPPPPENCQPISLFDLTLDTCRFPLGPHTQEAPFLFCGAKVREGSVYCDGHSKLCFAGRPVPTGRPVFNPFRGKAKVREL